MREILTLIIELMVLRCVANRSTNQSTEEPLLGPGRLIKMLPYGIASILQRIFTHFHHTLKYETIKETLDKTDFRL